MSVGASPVLRRDFDRWFRLALAVWVLIALATCVRGVLSTFSGRYDSVYTVYAEAGRSWLTGTGLYPAYDGFGVFRYAPLIAALLVPFGVLPVAAGEFCWRLLNVAVYVGGLLWWARAALPRALTPRERVALLLLAALFSASGLLDAQANPLVMGLLLLTTAAAAEQRWTWAAVCVTGACLLKVYPASLALLLLAVYPRRFGPRLAAVLAGCLALPFLLQRPDYVLRQYAGWWRLLGRDDGRQDFPLDVCYRDLRLLCRVWLWPLKPVAYAALQLGVGAVLAGLCLLGRRVGWSRQQLVNVALGLSCCWMLVLGPATEGVTYLFLAAPLTWALVEVFGKRRSWPARTTILAAAGCLLTAFVAVWFPSGKRLHQLGLHPLAGLLTFAYLFADALQRTWRPIDARRTVILTRSESLPDRQAAG